MQTEIENWLNWLRVSGSPNTVPGYGWELRALAKFFPDKPVEAYTLADLTAYLAARRARPGRKDPEFSDAAIRRSVSAFKSFFKFTLGADTSPAKALKRPTVKRRPQRTLDAAQALAVLASCDTSTVAGCRDLALLALMMDSGLRAAEVCRLRLAEMEMGRRLFRVKVKGGNVEYGGYSLPTAAYIARWLDLRGEYARPEVDTLFVSLGGGTPGQSLTTNGLRVMFRAIGKRAGLAKFAPHDLRRTFATLMIRYGAPTKVVQVAGRWEHLGMVEGYARAIHLADSEAFLPVGRLME